MKVTGFAFVGHPVANLQRARAFYEEVLKLPAPNMIDGSLDSDTGMLEYEIGPHTLAITTAWSDGKRPENPSGGLVIEVEDFKQAVDHIRSHNFEFDIGPFEGPSCSIAVVSDPDGNRIGIHKRRVAGKSEVN
jgi:predicted enzyme related to lactoylglutathione lyase